MPGQIELAEQLINVHMEMNCDRKLTAILIILNRLLTWNFTRTGKQPE